MNMLDLAYGAIAFAFFCACAGFLRLVDVGKAERKR